MAMRTLIPDVTAGPRADILACVIQYPGIHLRRVERETGLPLGQVLYHLDRLERMDLVTSARDAGFKRYFAARAIGRAEKPILAALRHTVPRRALLALLDAGSLSHGELQRVLGVAPSTLSFHVARLVDAGVLARERRGATNTYSIVDAPLVHREVLAYGPSFHDPEVDRYVQAQLAAPFPS